jgi:hypothetical protein
VDPAAFGLPTEDDGARDDPMLGRNFIATTHYQYDFEALSRATTAASWAGRDVPGVLAETNGVTRPRVIRPE